MTLQRYGPPDVPVQASPVPDVRPGAMTAVKVLVAVVLVGAGLAAAGLTGLIAAIVYSGCFLECSDPDHVGGLLLGLLALGLLVGGCSLAVVMWRRARTWRAVQVWAAVVLGGPGLFLVLGLGRSALGVGW